MSWDTAISSPLRNLIYCNTIYVSTITTDLFLSSSYSYHLSLPPSKISYFFFILPSLLFCTTRFFLFLFSMFCIFLHCNFFSNLSLKLFFYFSKYFFIFISNYILFLFLFLSYFYFYFNFDIFHVLFSSSSTWRFVCFR